MEFDSNPELEEGMEDLELLESLIPNTCFSKTFLESIFLDLYELISRDVSEGNELSELTDRLEILQEMVEDENVLSYIAETYSDDLKYFFLRITVCDHKEVVMLIVKLTRNLIRVNWEKLPFEELIVQACFLLCNRMDTNVLKFSFEIFYVYVSNGRSLQEIVIGFLENSFVELVHFVLFNSLSNELLSTLLLLLSQLLRFSHELCQSYHDILSSLPSDVYQKDVSITCGYALCLIEIDKNGFELSDEIFEDVLSDLHGKRANVQCSKGELMELYTYATVELRKRLCKSESNDEEPGENI